jgi:hypothetical protein
MHQDFLKVIFKYIVELACLSEYQHSITINLEKSDYLLLLALQVCGE